MVDIPKNCAHCGSRLKKWRVPEDATWNEEHFWVCFNDDCPYYKRGWKWMKEHYNQHASYRYAVNPTNGSTMMIPVWSDAATREMIEENDEDKE
jgi:hypothetical protein